MMHSDDGTSLFFLEETRTIYCLLLTGDVTYEFVKQFLSYCCGGYVVPLLFNAGSAWFDCSYLELNDWHGTEFICFLLLLDPE